MKLGISFESLFTPVNFALLTVCAYLLYRIVRTEASSAEKMPLPPMQRRDFTLQELRKFDGSNDERILIGVKGKVFDVTKGKRFYGPGESGMTV